MLKLEVLKCPDCSRVMGGMLFPKEFTILSDFKVFCLPCILSYIDVLKFLGFDAKEMEIKAHLWNISVIKNYNSFAMYQAVQNSIMHFNSLLVT